MTDRLKEIKERELHATRGPWQAFQWGDGSQIDTGLWNVGIPVNEAALVDDILEGDAEFIAHARQDIPWLISEVKRLREALEEIAAQEGMCIFGCPELMDADGEFKEVYRKGSADAYDRSAEIAKKALEE